MHRTPALLAAVAALTLSVGCGNTWPTAQAQQFVDGCEAGGSSSGLCFCVLDKLEGKYTPEQVTNADTAATQDITRAYADCANGG
jgi:hypothetical protein